MLFVNEPQELCVQVYTKGVITLNMNSYSNDDNNNDNDDNNFIDNIVDDDENDGVYMGSALCHFDRTHTYILQGCDLK